MPAQAGIHDFEWHIVARRDVDARLRGHDGYGVGWVVQNGR